MNLKNNTLKGEKPGFLLILIIVVSFLLVTHGGTGYTQSGLLLYGGTGILTLYSLIWLFQNKGTIQKKQLYILLTIFFFMLMPTVTGLIKFKSLTPISYLLMNLVIFFFISQLILRTGDSAMHFLSILFIWAAILSSLGAIYIASQPFQFAGLMFGRGSDYYRLQGTFSTPNRFGEVAAIGALSAFYLFRFSPQNKTLHFLFFLFLVIVMLASGSKGVIFGFVCAFLFYIYVAKIFKQRSFWVVLFIFLPILIITYNKIHDYIIVATRLDLVQSGQIDITTGRTTIWDQAIELFQRGTIFSKIFGNGATAFISLTGRDVHNTYYYLLVDYGIMGLLFVCIVIFFIFKYHRKNKTNKNAFILGTSLVIFCLARGIAMPTIFNGFNFAMIAFWTGVALVFLLTKSDISKYGTT